VLLSWFFDLKECGFLSALPISHDSDDFPELEIIDTCLFSEFSGSGFFYGFFYPTASFWQRNLSCLMTDAEDLCICSSLAGADTACTGRKPKEGREIAFYISERERNGVYFLFHRGIV